MIFRVSGLGHGIVRKLKSPPPPFAQPLYPVSPAGCATAPEPSSAHAGFAHAVSLKSGQALCEKRKKSRAGAYSPLRMHRESNKLRLAGRGKKRFRSLVVALYCGKAHSGNHLEG
jgi:hypothetical protein